MRIKFLMFIVLLTTCLCVKGQIQTIDKIFVQMPDSLMPYLTKNNKLDMIDFVKANMKSEVNNRLNGTSVMLTLDSTYLKIQMNPAVNIEMKLLKPAGQLVDSAEWVVCMLKTLGNNGSESEVDFYTSKWNKLDINSPFHEINQSDFLFRPDTMSIEEYNEAIDKPNAYMYSANLSNKDESMILWISTTILPTEQKSIIKPTLRSKRLLWNGYMFK